MSEYQLLKLTEIFQELSFQILILTLLGCWILFEIWSCKSKIDKLEKLIKENKK